jgi:uncharacterized protein YggE
LEGDQEFMKFTNRRLHLQFLLAVALVVLCLPWPVMAGEMNRSGNKATSITVTGMSEISYKPDTAVVVLGADMDEIGGTAGSVQDKVNIIMNSIVESIKKLKIPSEDIRTIRMDINPIYRQDKDNGREILDGYHASHRLSITTQELNLTGQIIDAAISAGATTIDYVKFELKDSGSAKLEALKRATEDAQKKAGVMAAALGLKIVSANKANEGMVQVVTDTQETWGRTLKFNAAAMSSNSTAIQENEIIVRAQVSMEFTAKTETKK